MINLGGKSMTKKLFASLLLGLGAPVAFAMLGAPQGSLDQSVEGEYLVKLKGGSANLQTLGTLYRNGLKLERKVKSQAEGLYTAKLNRAQALKSLSLDAAISNKGLEAAVLRQLSKVQGVEYVEPNFIFRALESNPMEDFPVAPPTNDPMYGQLWGMPFIQAPEAWQLNQGSKDVIVAVIDTGIDYNHPDLKDNMWTMPGTTDVHGYNAINDKTDPMDDHYHGTHVAGTIGAVGNNSIGVVGVSWNVSLMGVKFLSAQGSGTLEDAVEAIDWATVNGAKVMNNSWGGGGFTQTLKDAIQRTADAGVVFLAAAGNDSNDNDANPSYPATYDVPNIISVAALQQDGGLAWFSSFGRRTVHVAAPGVGIQSTSTGNSYRSLDGTSMATPHAAGAVALLLAHEPSLSYADVKNRVTSTAVKDKALAKKVAFGGAVLNVNNMLNNIVPPGPITIPDEMWSEPVAQAIETAHPYANSAANSWVVEMAGATHYRLHFTRLETENRYDTVKIINNVTNEVLETFTGTFQSDFWTDDLEAPSLRIEFSSDSSVQAWGFNIDSVKWVNFQAGLND
jgi:thermitase